MTALYIGLGCRRGCPLETLESALRQALQDHGLAPSAICGIATVTSRANEPALVQLAERHGLQLQHFDAPALERFEAQLSHRSAVAHLHTGCWGVAESAALALAWQVEGQASLVLTRQVHGPTTLAMARGR
ncbi:cobalamin biosynthesis protein [Enterobacterales bacterium BD_CKDN230030183-1A_HGKHYDSX7]